MRKKISIITGVIVLLVFGIVIGRYANETIIFTDAKTTAPATTTSTTEPSTVDYTINAYMKEKGLTLKAKDIQFDMKNNVDKEFAIEGSVELADYYNYGFTDESKYFCIKVSADNTVSNSWYLYCDRTVYSKLFDILKENGKPYITATGIITSSKFKDGQGNMAEAEYIKWQ
ncbi:hypothetical protein [Clostridium estertheticum]|uniref:hypothetical protein n=1 Tax=Clostridium estertheticum TaxID=238834 RepID=UPI001C0C46B7|nr:hypothetical protein [Clostridium estertheticum]MBU3186658.1 hypothetical protein [Clostridium estertheticum]